MPRRHHFLPQFYLSRFAGRDGKLTVYRRGSARPPIRPYPKQFGFERGLYEIDPASVSADLDPEYVERAFSRWESDAARAFAHIERHGFIDVGEHFQALLWFTCLTAERTPSARADHDCMADGVAKGHVLAILQDPDGRRKHPELASAFDVRLDGSGAVDVAAVLRRMERVRLRRSTTEWALSLIEFALARLETYCKMTWTIGHVPPASGFVTSDSPVAHGHLPGYPVFDRVNIAVPEAEVSFPLSPDIALIGAWRPRRPATRLDAGHVEEINRRTVWRSERWVISHRSRPTTAAQVRELGRSKRVQVHVAAAVDDERGTPGVIVRSTVRSAPQPAVPQRRDGLRLLAEGDAPTVRPAGHSPFGGLVDLARRHAGNPPIPRGLHWRELTVVDEESDEERGPTAPSS